MSDELDEILYMNPRVNSEKKKEFEKNLFLQKQDGVKVNMSIFIRAVMDKFNEDPDAMLKDLGLKT